MIEDEHVLLVAADRPVRPYIQRYWYPFSPYCVLYGTVLMSGAVDSLIHDQSRQLLWTIWAFLRALNIWLGASTIGYKKTATVFYINLYLIGIVLAYMAIYYNNGLKGLTYVCTVNIFSVIFDTIWLTYLLMNPRELRQLILVLHQNHAELPPVAPNTEYSYAIDISKVEIIYWSPANQLGSYEPCVVCLEPYQVENYIMKLHCGHMYHYECISPWLKTRGVCPLCRSKESVLVQT